MKRIVLLLGFFVFVVGEGLGQEADCITPAASKENVEFIKKALSGKLRSRTSALKDEIKWAGIKFHIGSSILTNVTEIDYKVTRVLFELNKIYLPSGVQFYKSGNVNSLATNSITLTNWPDVDFGNSNIPTEFIQLSTTQEFALDAINLYVYDNILLQGQSSGSQTNGIAMFPSVVKGSNIAAIRTDKFDIGLETIIHELGHYFNLWHTHHNSSISETGSCSDGDFISDTPVDPFVKSSENPNNQYFKISSSCNFNGRNDVNTICGNAYSNFQPMTNNIMSYYHQYNCERNTFTPLQYLVLGLAYYQRQTSNYHINGDGGSTIPIKLSGVYQAGNIYLSWDKTDPKNGVIIEESSSVDGEYIPIKFVLPNTDFQTVKVSSNDLINKFYRVRNINSKVYSNIFHYQVQVAGVTVITHGFQLSGSMSGDWKKYANAVRNRLSKELGL